MQETVTSVWCLDLEMNSHWYEEGQTYSQCVVDIYIHRSDTAHAGGLCNHCNHVHVIGVL